MKKLNHIFLMLTCLMLLGSCGKQMETVTVHTAEELIKALKSDTHIIIDADGVFDINQAVINSNLPVVDWNSKQKGVVKYNEDDVTLRISLDNIIIEGADPNNKVHFLSNDEQADVLNLSGCSNVTIKNIKAGHLIPGDCSGDVISVSDCNNITIDNCELYGCGVVGVMADNSKNITIDNCWIYECSSAGVTMFKTENATISNTKIEYCRNAYSINDDCKNVVFSNCVTENNDTQSYEMNIVAKLIKMSGDKPFEGPDPEDLEDSQEPEYITDCYTGEVEHSDPEGANIKESELETVTVHNAEEFKNAIGSGKKIIIESSEKLSCKDEIDFTGIINMVIEGNGTETDFNFKFTSGCSDIRINNLNLAGIYIGAGCSGFDIVDCNRKESDNFTFIKIFDADNVFVNNSQFQGVLINKTIDVMFVSCRIHTSGIMVECHDVHNVWFKVCNFENDTESDGKSLFVLDDPVVFDRCEFSVTEWKVDFSNMKCINCPKTYLITNEDLADEYE